MNEKKEAPMHALWKGYITFGLISIPIKLISAIQSTDVSFNQLHKLCKSRIKYQNYCENCKKVIPRDEIIKGYELSKGEYVVFNENELEELHPSSSKTMEIIEVIKLDEIDPIYFDKPYYIIPDEGGELPYKLLLITMKNLKKAALVKFVIYQKENVAILRPFNNIILLHTLLYKENIRAIPEETMPGEINITSKEISLAEKLLECLSGKFNPEKYKNEYREKLMKLIEAKAKGKVISFEQPKVKPASVNILDALQESLKVMMLPKKPSAVAKIPKSKKKIQQG